MVPKGVELIVGLQNDSQFGPVIMVGLGGIMTEVMKDVAFRMLPITTSDAKSMINELSEKFKKLIEDDETSFPIAGYKGKIYSRAIKEPGKNFQPGDGHADVQQGT